LHPEIIKPENMVNKKIIYLFFMFFSSLN